MKNNIISELKGMPLDESVFIILNVNNITEIRPMIGSINRL